MIMSKELATILAITNRLTDKERKMLIDVILDDAERCRKKQETD